MKSQIWWAVAWKHEKECDVATTFDPKGVQVPMMYQRREDARERCRMAAETYGMKPHVVRKVRISKVTK